MKKFIKILWPWLLCLVLSANVIYGIWSLFGSRELKRDNERLREELARQQQYVPLLRDTIRDTVEVVTQQIVEVERLKNVLTAEDKALLKDLHTKVSSIETFQKMGMQTSAEVTLQPQHQAGAADSKSDTLLTFHDDWLDLTYNTHNRDMLIQMQDSLAIVVEREYKRRFLWWRWGVKGYRVKAVNYSPYSTIRYNNYVKQK